MPQFAVRLGIERRREFFGRFNLSLFSVSMHAILVMINRNLPATRRVCPPECAIALILGMLTVASAAGQAISTSDTVFIDLPQAVRLALEASPEILATASSVDHAVARSRLAKSNRFLPEANLTTAHTPVPAISNPNNSPTDELFLDPDVGSDWSQWGMFNELAIEVVQPVYTWGQISNSIRAAEYGIEVEEAARSTAENEVAFRTADLYFKLLLGEALVRFAEESLQVVDSVRSEAERLLDEGYEDIWDADLFRVLIAEQEVRAELVLVREGREKARAALIRQLLLPDGTPLEPSDLLLEPTEFVLDSLDVYLAVALDHRPELQQASSGFAARDALVNVAKSDLYPKLYVAGQFSVRGAPGRYQQSGPYHSDPTQGGGYGAGVGFRMNLNLMQTKAKVEQALAQRQVTRYQFEAAQQLVLFEVEEAYRNVLVAQEAMRAQHEAMRISREWLRTEEINFDLEIVRAENLVEAVGRNLELKAKGFQATYAFNRTVLRLLWTTGTLADQVRNGPVGG